MSKQIVMYSRTMGCPFVSVAKRVFEDHALAYQEVFIDKDMAARQRVLQWTGFLSVPTIVIAEAGSNLPYADVTPLEPGRSPRGIHRGAMITEPNVEQLTDWLMEHGFIVNAPAGEG
jgi:glutaredoxin